MMIREPAQAGRFYASSRQACQRELVRLFDHPADIEPMATASVGGIVPHAGWMYSGRVAAQVLDAIATQRSPDTFVIFGAVHHPIRPVASLYARGAWNTPLGEVPVDERLAERILSCCLLVEEDPYAHEHEHSIEVQIPLIQHRVSDVKIVPIMIRPCDTAIEVGRAVGRTINTYGHQAVILASTDLTHYGPRFGFAPKGEGPDGLRWAKEVNDRKVIDQMLAMQAAKIVPDTQEHRNACGGGAIAAALAACQELGATEGRLLSHTTSAEVDPTASFNPDAVGYAGLIFF